MGKRKKRRRSIPLDEELREVLQEQRERFRQKFGREPGPNDPVFFDRKADEPRPLDEEDLQAQMVAAMERAGVHPALIHAYRRTGRIVTRENIKYLSREERAEWGAAIEEYESLWERRN